MCHLCHSDETKPIDHQAVQDWYERRRAQLLKEGKMCSICFQEEGGRVGHIKDRQCDFCAMRYADASPSYA